MASKPENDVPMPSGPPPKRRIDLGASTFVPALARSTNRAPPSGGLRSGTVSVTSSRSFRAVRPLAARRPQGKGCDGGTVEVAHEALFREWARLKEWLEPERARLEALRSLQIAAATWERHGSDPAFLDHRGKRLAEASDARENDGYRKRLNKLDFDYLAACRKAESAGAAADAARAGARRRARCGDDRGTGRVE